MYSPRLRTCLPSPQCSGVELSADSRGPRASSSWANQLGLIPQGCAAGLSRWSQPGGLRQNWQGWLTREWAVRRIHIPAPPHLSSSGSAEPPQAEKAPPAWCQLLLASHIFLLQYPAARSGSRFRAGAATVLSLPWPLPPTAI